MGSTIREAFLHGGPLCKATGGFSWSAALAAMCAVSYRSGSRLDVIVFFVFLLVCVAGRALAPTVDDNRAPLGVRRYITT